MPGTGGAIRPGEWMGPEKLRSARLRRGMSRKDAAKEVGISLEMWNKMEQGVRMPGLYLAIRLHEYFGIPNEKLGITELSIRAIRDTRGRDE